MLLQLLLYDGLALLQLRAHDNLLTLRKCLLKKHHRLLLRQFDLTKV